MEQKDLLTQKCIPCEGDVQPFTKKQIQTYVPSVPDWIIVDYKKIERDFKFKNFVEAMKFINRVADLAEHEGHHPDIFLHNWNLVKIFLMTHAIKGLFSNDFILAAKIDHLLLTM